MKTTIRGGLWILATAVLLGGCASGVPLDESSVPVESRIPSALDANAAAAGGADSGAASESQVTSVDLAKSHQDAINNLPKVVYFDYDSFIIKDEYRPVIDTNARALVADRQMRASVQGHTDERGGREYNLALGQKRAEAVVKSLELLGANQNQLEAVSFGKERPAVLGHDEAAYAKNRRVEIHYR